ncbi:MAG: anaerobic ribonucleoside-triphosphate reductase activating protein [Candidatus Diapherotrites archaeon]|nr:anaerobic ribonucleoside-triphosphate reductase activating protein [Candidatus Diapherotrites archaeon]
MKIARYIPQSTTYWRGKIAFVLFASGCNMRCPFCYSSDVIKKTNTIQKTEFEKALNRVQWAIDCIVITGGEPTIYSDLPIFCKKMKLKRLNVYLETNGSNPSMLKKMLDMKVVDYIAMDVKAPLDKKRYMEITRSDISIENILKSIDILMHSNIDYEFRTTYTPELSEDEMLTISNQLSGARRWVIQQFRPENCLDESFMHYQKTPYEDIMRVASQAQGPQEIIIRTEEKGEEKIK